MVRVRAGSFGNTRPFLFPQSRKAMAGREDLHGRRWKLWLLMGILALALWGCTGLYFRHVPLEKTPPPVGVVSNLAFREQWQGFFLYGEKIGFSHFRIEEAEDIPGAFKISSEAVLRLKVMGIKEESLFKKVDYVTRDLRLLRVIGEQELDGEMQRMEAEVVGGGVRVET
jgi:hypothetical protein